MISMKEITEEESIELLRKYSDSPESFRKVLGHVKAVQKEAIAIASKVKDIDMYKIKIGSLLHDIGRFSCPPGKDRCKHGLIGGEILRKEGLFDIAKIAERHIGVGIKKEDIVSQKLPLPAKDFVPVSKEEKIIAHADNLIFGNKKGGFKEVVVRFKKELGDKYVERLIRLKEDIEDMCKSN